MRRRGPSDVAAIAEAEWRLTQGPQRWMRELNQSRPWHLRHSLSLRRGPAHGDLQQPPDFFGQVSISILLQVIDGARIGRYLWMPLGGAVAKFLRQMTISS